MATWVIAKLRNKAFTTLGELREAVGIQIGAYNREPFQKRAGSRISVFEAEERLLLRPLPAVGYEISEWVYGRRVARNSHITWAKNYYSVPYTHIGEKVDVRITAQMVEIYRNHQRLTSHVRLAPGVVNSYCTNDADLPPGPGYREWDSSRVRGWAHRVGPSTEMVVDRIFESVPIAEQGLDPALAVLRLSRRYSHTRLEAACTLALNSAVPSPRYAHLRPILESGQDKTGSLSAAARQQDTGGYVRGADYYAGGAK